MNCSAEFWPTGWLVWFTAAVGALDIGLLAFIAKCLLRAA